ncbi:hypothetical protein CL654_03185 [bacterium]|nr:hypothetical protein [bacterium]|tara:strand:+ start:25490 stop:26086 length:597 start_codon:yes stop_codon:yes gene_type:complete
MNKLLIAIIVIIILGAGWYFVSPLFLSTTVEDKFPFSVPTEEEFEQMTDEEKFELEMKMLEEAAKQPDVVMEETMPAEGVTPETEPAALASGEFKDADSFHKGSGDATIYRLPDGERLLRMENFDVTNGPDLRVLLVKNSDPMSRSDVGDDYIELGKLKGNKGNQNYEIPDDVDVDEYGSVVIYCKPFHVIFSTATLN